MISWTECFNNDCGVIELVDFPFILTMLIFLAVIKIIVLVEERKLKKKKR